MGAGYFAVPENYDRGVMVAAILTAVIRPSLETAPGILFCAPAAGSGKTLLAKCLIVLIGQPAAPMPPLTNDEAEMRKRLFACLKGGKPFIFFDNVTGVLNSATLAGFLTAEFFTDRVLGLSQEQTLPTNVLFLITGNNLILKGDLWRRILSCRIDAGSDAPEQREFELKPESYCAEHRQEIVSAALTLLNGYIEAGAPKLAQNGMASFDDWNAGVRNTVLWMQKEGITDGIAELGDPCHGISEMKELDPDRHLLGIVLECLFLAFDGSAFTAGEVIKKVSDPNVELFRDSDDGDGTLKRLSDAVNEIVSAKTRVVSDSKASKRSCKG